MLILPVLIATRLDRSRLSRWNASHVDQKMPHRQRSNQRHQHPRTSRGHQNVGPPMQPLEKVIGVPRVFPQTRLANLTLVGFVLLKPFQLQVRQCLTNDRYAPDHDRNIVQPTKSNIEIRNHQQRPSKNERPNSLKLVKTKHPKRSMIAPFIFQRRVSFVFRMLLPTTV